MPVVNRGLETRPSSYSSPRRLARAAFSICGCALGSLLALSWALTLVYPGSRPFPVLRYTASFLGFGWCDPTPLPYREWSFAPAEGPGLTWEGDAAFWAHFPCARSAYRVWEPEGPPMRGAADAEDPPACQSLIVTAFFDIGRGKWPPPFARSVGSYLEHIRVVLTLRNPMVIFTSPDFADDFVRQRRALGLMDRTLVVAMDPHCAPQAWMEQSAATTMCRTEAWSGSLYLGTPERQEPWYNLVMWMKAGFFRAAATLPHAALAAPWVTWLDIGCHPPMCSEALAGTCVDPAPWARPDRIRIAQVAPHTDWVASHTPLQFIRGHLVTFAGTVFGTGRANAAPAMDLFLDTVGELLGRGVADTDQTVFAWLFNRKPDAVDAYHAYVLDWGRVVEGYRGHAPGHHD